VNRREPTGGSACPNAANQVVRVSRDMCTDWVNFASTGNPGWASYDPNTRSTRVYTASRPRSPTPLPLFGRLGGASLNCSYDRTCAMAS
jgi:hypothetical protein